ncbi:MAG: hypothetical protein BGO31_06075 [Bacteroidetes bacterium 43-16]|nr:MAG: hypothetical protein BGO31_06075 [Bacteroidetes bacterium 43-16]
MKKPLFLFFLCATTGINSLAQTTRHALGIKPFNFSNIVLQNEPNDHFGVQFGLEYEYCFSKSKKFSAVLPLTYGVINENNSLGSKLQGREFYISPGLKFYPGTTDQASGHSFGLNFLLGKAQYSYTYPLAVGDIDLKYLGFLANYNYSVRLWRTLSLRPEAGIGCRFQSKNNDFIFVNDVGPDNGWISGNETHNKAVLIGNLSIGLHYRF